MDGSESNGCRAAVLLKPIKVPDDTNKGSVVCVARVIKQPSSVIRLCYDHPHNRALAVILLLVTERKPRICVLIAVRKAHYRYNAVSYSSEELSVYRTNF